MPLPPPTFDSLPNLSESHLVADYIELLCLIHLDRNISRADVIDRIRERSDVEPQLQDGRVLEVIDVADDVEDDPATLNDAWERKADDWFSLLDWRATSFKDWYPFQVAAKSHQISAPADLTDKQLVYIFLLIASALRHFNKRDQTLIASAFEVVGLEALRAYMPRGSEVHMFGKHPLNRGRYSGKLFNRLRMLGGHIGGNLLCEPGDFDPRDTGDKGLDLVAWVPFGDTAWGVLGVFVQCACTLEWITKQNATSEKDWAQYLQIIPHPLQFTFIPFSYRTAGGDWLKPKKRTTVLVDRTRLLHLLRRRVPAVLPHVQAYTDKVLKTVEAAV